MASSLIAASTVPSTATAAAAAAEVVGVAAAPAESEHEESFFSRFLSFLHFAKGKGFDSSINCKHL